MLTCNYFTLEKLWNERKNAHLTDFEIIFRDQTFFCHKALAVLCSKTIAALVSSHQNTLIIDDELDASDLLIENIINSFYGFAFEVGNENAVELMSLAPFMGMSTLHSLTKCVVKEFSTKTYSISLSSILLQLENDQFRDFSLIYKNVTISLHKFILHTFCPSFLPQFNLQPDCNEWDLSKWLNVSESSLENFFSSFYKDQITVTLENIFEITHLASYFRFSLLESFCDSLMTSVEPSVLWIFPALQSADEAEDLRFAGIMSSVLARVEDLSQSNPIAVRPEVLSLLVNNVNVHWLTTVLVHSYCHYDSTQDQRVWTPNEMQQLLNQIDTNTLAIDLLFSIIKPLLGKEELYDVLSEFSLARFSKETSQVPIDWLVWLMIELNKHEPSHNEMTRTNSFASKFASLVSSELLITMEPLVLHHKSFKLYLRTITQTHLVLWFLRSLIISWKFENHWTVDLFDEVLNEVNFDAVDADGLLKELKPLRKISELLNCYYKFISLKVAPSIISHNNSLAYQLEHSSSELERTTLALKTLCKGETPNTFFVDDVECIIYPEELLGQSPYSTVYRGKFGYQYGVVFKLVATSEEGHREIVEIVNKLKNLSCETNLCCPFPSKYDSTVLGTSRLGQTTVLICRQCEWYVSTVTLVSLAYELKMLHCRDIVHGRIKPQNLLMNYTGEVFLLDVGISSIISKYNQIPLDLDTARYCAPEVIQNPSHCSKAADIYSFAVLAYELITGELPFGSVGSLEELLQVKSRNNHLQLLADPSGFPGQIPFSRFISPNPSERPTIDEVLKCFKIEFSITNRAFDIDNTTPPEFHLTVDHDTNATVADVLDYLGHIYHITPSHFLSCFNSPLSNDTQLSKVFHLWPFYNPRLMLDSRDFPEFRTGCQLFVKDLTGHVITIPFEGGDDVSTLKDRIAERLGIHPPEQRLIYGCRHLEEGRTLQDYNIQKESTILVVLRLRGGKPIILFHPPSDGWKLSLSVTLDPSFWTFTHVYPGKTFNNYTMNWNDLVIDSTGLISGSKDFSLPVSSLFWEAEAPSNVAKSLFEQKWEGSVVVPRIDCAKILHQNLLQVGFTPRDATEMVTYWQPTIEQIFKQNIEMVFVDPDLINSLARIDVSIKVPIYRFFIVFRGVDAACTSSIFLRDPYNGGYNRENCIMEWGGMHLIV
ncbi:hypothetical protein RCL1_001156 [Eukaryota sp. TZLM3-RCL]